ncbi:hypothetical protein ACET3X_007729 [Alternaria dauci]|uniref:CCHC-type domain-containing protein n=1 Tax=Alternaria dauci TaxID=48095 RepID=A0ABR3UEA2_9PLEO
MASLKRKPDDGDADWEVIQVAKPPKFTQDTAGARLQEERGNYESMTSQRPMRERKRPERFADLSYQVVSKKKKATPKRVTQWQDKAPRKSSLAAKNPASQRSRVEPYAVTDTVISNVEDSPELPEKMSKIVRLKLPLTGSILATPMHHSRQQYSDESESKLSSPPASLPSSPLFAYKSRQTSLLLEGRDQCAQRIPEPVPASSQDVATVYTTQNLLTSQVTGSQRWEQKTPGESIHRVTAFAHPAQTQPSLRSPENHGPIAYPTPDSALYRDPSTARSKLNPQLENSQAHNQDPDCEKCGKAGHTEHNCSVTAPIPGTPDRIGGIEAWLRADNPTSQIKPPSGDVIEPAPSLYAASEATTECEELGGPLVGEQDSIPNVDYLRDLTEQLLVQQNKGPHKPEPQGQPEVWADGRQELCETLHYYRAYQSACYSTGGFARGFMFDKVAHDRDYMDGDIVISRAGGGLIKDIDSGEMKLKRDQSEDSAAVGLRNCMIHRNPVVIITGADNPNIASKPPHQYCVLDYFKPTHVWVEKSGDSKIVRYRFEKLNTKKESWWQAKDAQEVVELGSLPSPVEKPTCAAFWKIYTPTAGPRRSAPVKEPKEASLVYDPRFLKQKTPWHNDDHDYPLVSNAAELSRHAVPGENTSVAFWSGMVCPDCGRCTSRLNWTNWKCSNTVCQYTRTPPHTLIPALSLRDPLWPVTSSYMLSRDTVSPRLGLKVSFEHGYRINRYEIPGVNGFIAHMVANKTVLEEDGGPDAMFEELQQTDIGLQRRSMPNGQLKGPNYCRHFAVNYGMPYKFIAATASHSFTGAARPITSTRSRLNWAAKLLLAEENGKSMEEVRQEWQEKEFNEVLALGYFEEQRINYHDDGEFGLGPTIATLSLGAPGTMRIRMKARHYHGVSSGAGLYDDAAPIPGCQQYEARLALQPSLDVLKRSDTKTWNARRRQIPKELGLTNRGNAKDVLTMQLGHGDIVIMHGADVQKYYEHAVEHAGKLRFALTCRYIDPESLKPEDRPKYAVGPDTEGYDG